MYPESSVTNLPPTLPPTGQVIICAAYLDRFAILSEANGAIIGSHYEGNSNEIWTFISQTGFKQYKISTITDAGDQAFAQSSDPSEADTVYGTSLASIYKVTPTDGARHRISIPSPSGDLYWTLENQNEGTPITLHKERGDSTQIWKITTPPAY